MSFTGFFEVSLLVTAVAVFIERAVGYPAILARLVGHPVAWVGSLVSWCDRAFNRPEWSEEKRKLVGMVVLLFVTGAAGGLALLVAILLRSLPLGWIAEAMLASSMLSQKELGERVEAVADGLDEGLEEGREAVRHLVGRDHDSLGESEIAKGAIESLAENSSDGIVAPAMWMLLGGLFGAVLYKTVNTLDSMLGYRTERYRSFGWASARFDDLLNLVPSRFTGLMYCFCMLLLDRGRAGLAWRAMVRDAPKHLSPNAGYPEAAMAGALDVALGGPRPYDGKTLELAHMGAGRKAITSSDVRLAIALYRLMLTMLVLVLAVPVIVLIFP